MQLKVNYNKRANNENVILKFRIIKSKKIYNYGLINKAKLFYCKNISYFNKCTLTSWSNISFLWMLIFYSLNIFTNYSVYISGFT